MTRKTKVGQHEGHLQVLEVSGMRFFIYKIDKRIYYIKVNEGIVMVKRVMAWIVVRSPNQSFRVSGE